MKCKTCDYALWNLRTRTCPECGGAFDPRDYEFVPTSVRFCCPNCNQAYYGTDEKGHLVPQEFACVTCGLPVSMGEMIVLPAEGVHERETTFLLPWFERRDLGRFRAWWRTIGWGFAYASNIGRGLEPISSARQAINFACMTLALTLVLLCLPVIVIPVISFGGGGGPSVGSMLAGVGLFCAGALAVIVVGLGLGILAAHGTLRVLGTGGGRLGRTTESICYSCGPMVTSGVPCLGFYLVPIGWIWWMISAALALAEAHSAKVWKCIVAMLVPAVLIPAVPIAAYAIFIWSMIGGAMFGGASLVTQMAVQPSVSSLVMAWRIESASRTGEPMHASQLLASGFVDPDAFLAASTSLLLEDIAVGSLTLADFDASSSSFTVEQQTAVQEASEALPADVIAHRLGDFVFTYHGIEQSKAPQLLWVVILDPETGGSPAPERFYVVGKVSGETDFFSTSEFAAELKDQNRLRRGYGLAPLPMPDTVTHERPATAGDQ